MAKFKHLIAEVEAADGCSGPGRFDRRPTQALASTFGQEAERLRSAWPGTRLSLRVDGAPGGVFDLDSLWSALVGLASGQAAEIGGNPPDQVEIRIRDARDRVFFAVELATAQAPRGWRLLEARQVCKAHGGHWSVALHAANTVLELALPKDAGLALSD